jgi:Dolichyl-phosphate-mannose-protein mannosyltransferase
MSLCESISSIYLAVGGNLLTDFTIFLSVLARALGAQSFGTTFTAFVTSLAPAWVAIDHQFAMNALEPLSWIGCALVLVRIIQTENPKLWMAFGMLAGLGLENKYSMAVFAFAPSPRENSRSLSVTIAWPSDTA